MVGKRSLGKVLSRSLPQCLLTCFGMLSSLRFAGEKRPIITICVGNKQIRALIDTGSAVTLCSSSLLPGLREFTTRLHKKPLDLRAANGLPLHISDYRAARVTLNSRTTPTDVFFVDNLQVPCILGMDFLHKAGILIDAGKRRLLFRPRHLPTSSPNRPRTSKATFLSLIHI